MLLLSRYVQVRDDDDDDDVELIIYFMVCDLNAYNI